MPQEVAPPLYFDPPPNLLQRHPALKSMARDLAVGFSCGNVQSDHFLQSVGLELWRVLNAREALQEACETARENVVPLVVRSDEEDVQNLPWECLYHPCFGFLARDSRFALSRGRTYLHPPKPATKGPLQVLLFAPHAEKFKARNPHMLDAKSEQDIIVKALDPLIQEGKALVTISRDGRFDAFKEMARDQFHLIFLSGYGHRQEGFHGRPLMRFYFETKRGELHAVDAQSLADAAAGEKTRCLVLSARKRDHSESCDLAGGLASAFWGAGVPNVVAIREPVVKEAGARFENELCQRLGMGGPLDEAVQAARRVMAAPLKSMPSNSNHEAATGGQWSLPVCYSDQAHAPLLDWGAA